MEILASASFLMFAFSIICYDKCNHEHESRMRCVCLKALLINSCVVQTTRLREIHKDTEKERIFAKGDQFWSNFGFRYDNNSNSMFQKVRTGGN